MHDDDHGYDENERLLPLQMRRKRQQQQNRIAQKIGEKPLRKLFEIFV